jgi:hypothetical protein
MSVSMEALQVAHKEMFVLARFVLGVIAILTDMRVHPMLQTGSWQ